MHKSFNAEFTTLLMVLAATVGVSMIWLSSINGAGGGAGWPQAVNTSDPGVSNLTGYQDIQNATNANLSTIMDDIRNGSSVNAPIIGTVTYPNPFALFTPVLQFFTGLARLPYDLLGAFGMPTYIRNAFLMLLSIIVLLAAIAWFRGGSSA